MVWVAVPTETPTGSIGTNEEVGQGWGAKIVTAGKVVLLMFMFFILRRR